MNATGRLGLYGVGLLAIFGIAFAVAKPLVPDDAAERWAASAESHDQHAPDPASTHSDLFGLASATSGYALSPIAAPTSSGVDGTLAFRIDAAHGPLTDYTTAHDKQLHLIVVRTDGSGYRHVHPQLNTTTGIWSIPWTWTAAGTYRIYTDFTPVSASDSITLSRTVDVAGDLRPTPPTGPVTSANVDGYTVNLAGDLAAGRSADLRVTVTRAGAPVTSLQPYLGAFGHLVALRQGDLAYLHVHAMGDEPTVGARSGPVIDFMATAPSAGRYLLYLDFQVDGVVRTAAFVLDATTDHEVTR